MLSVDLDGDAVADRVRVLGADVEIRLTKPPSTTKFSFDREVFGGMLVWFDKLPLAGLPGREEALRFIENASFSKICTAPDPSLQRLLQQVEAHGKPTPLMWVEGPARSGSSYLVREQDRWLLYRSYCYSSSSPRDPYGPSPLEEMAREGPFVVSRTCHGVVLSDLEHNRYAWLYLLDQGISKLRHSSIGKVTLSKGVVTIELTLDTLEFGDAVEARVSITDGSMVIVRRTGRR